jgi:hypothetical protein
MRKSARFALVAVIVLLSSVSAAPPDELKAGFLSPPDTARPGVYWYFMDGNLDRGAITADLESMKAAGIGYALFLEVNVGVPRGKVDMLSPEWQDLYAHAVREAERLGIRIIMGSGPGWAGSGGPWVRPEQSMAHLVASSTEVQGPVRFDAALPVPEPRRPFFGDNTLTPELKRIRDGWYEDVAVLAVLTPAVKRSIESVDEKALYYRAPYTSQPGVVPFIPAPASYAETSGAAVRQNQIVDLTSRFEPGGRLRWDVPAGQWTILRFGTRNNGAVTRPAPAPGLGFESDKFSTAAIDAHFEAYLGTLIRRIGPRKPGALGGLDMVHIDSWEMGAQNWTGDFRQEFHRRRGYDPLPFLPAYTGLLVGSLEQSERFLWDVRQTSNELIVERHAGRFKELGRRFGFPLSIEPYDMNPAADLDLGAVADVPMGEFWSDGFGFNSAFSAIEATSVGHVLGRPVIAAEAFTADRPEAWKLYPGALKNQGDWAFAMGLNRLIFHTFAHKPYGDRLRPGVTMGPFGVHWDRGQTWWPMVADYHRYLSRCQFLLSQGRPVADILYLAAEGAPHVFRPPASALDGTATLPDKKAYAFDGVSPRILIDQASVRNGRIVFPGGASYRVLVLPAVETTTPELLTKIESLINAGALVIGGPPRKSPSLTGYPACDREVSGRAEVVWGGLTPPASVARRPHGRGRIYWGGELSTPAAGELYPGYAATTKVLEAEGAGADFVTSAPFRYAHHSFPDREVYFVSNRTGEPVTGSVLFRDGTRAAELWDAVTGTIAGLPVRRSKQATGAETTLHLDAHQSGFVVFYRSNLPDVAAVSVRPGDGASRARSELTGPWTVAFDPAWGGPDRIVFDQLSDWTARPEEGIRFYSGIARYSKTFDLPAAPGASPSTDWVLDLGTVKNMARVRLNGKDLGVVWTAPWQVTITGAVQPKNNRLEIEVANLWINRLIGDEQFPDDGVQKGRWPDWVLNGTRRPTQRFTFTTHRFYKKGDPLQPSGLIGPVTIGSRN